MEKESPKEVQTLKAHLAMNVENVERSLDFYRKMLGIEPSKVRRGYAKFDVQNPPLNLTLNELPGVVSGALSHLGIQVASTEDVLAVRERWHKEGFETHDEMQTNCCYAIQDKTWVLDPDGNQWEVFVVLEDNLAETTACCTTDAAEQSGVASACATSTASEADAQHEGATASTASSSCCSTTAAPTTISR